MTEAHMDRLIIQVQQTPSPPSTALLFFFATNAKKKKEKKNVLLIQPHRYCYSSAHNVVIHNLFSNSA